MAMLPGESFDVRPAAAATDDEQAAAVRALVRKWARDSEDEARLLDELGLTP